MPAEFIVPFLIVSFVLLIFGSAFFFSSGILEEKMAKIAAIISGSCASIGLIAIFVFETSSLSCRACLENNDYNRFIIAQQAPINIIEITDFNVNNKKNTYFVTYIDEINNEYITQEHTVEKIQIDSSIDKNYIAIENFEYKGLFRFVETKSCLMIKNAEYLDELIDMLSCTEKEKNVIKKEILYNAR